ncbi:LysR family transcriptional regulator [Fusibacter paucivorans]|uniref:LysR family transcriptional regulator n=1 Tax=Fusibacter paucivorans TaxID=76009 RepID=A0ABS5PMH2_9FIRM|nr:LysR family transcriptional regulator [Fusibacter paucivorans]MBS7526241.1 LysR family transcriptional regulator [Fusibacter paucivorans]
MTRRHFQIFTAVCDNMNMTLAAKTLYISQSAVSQAIQELESQYGVRFFERLSRKLYLTSAGESLLSYARHVLRLYEDIEAEMKAYEQNAAIRIGASVTVATCVLPILIVSFQKAYPNINITITEDNTAAIEQLLMNDQLDIGLIEGEITTSDLLELPFMSDHLVFICSPDHPFAGKQNLSPEKLDGENFILREIGSGTRKKFEDTMRAAQQPWQTSWTCNNADTIKNAVALNLGLTVISERAVADYVESNKLAAFTVRGVQFNRTFRIAFHKHKYLTKSLLCFKDFCLHYSQKSVSSTR